MENTPNLYPQFTEFEAVAVLLATSRRTAYLSPISFVMARHRVTFSAMRSQLWRRKFGRPTAIDHHHLPSHERRVITGEKDRGVTDIPRISETSHGVQIQQS